jgi:5-deoxy-glucuronate isomerase
MNVCIYDKLDKNPNDYIDLNDHQILGMKNIFLNVIELRKGCNVKIGHNFIEMAIIILSGNIKVKDLKYKIEYDLKRKSVFAEKATSVFVPHYENITIEASETSQLIICGAFTVKANQSQSLLLSNKTITSKHVGKETYSRRVDSIIDNTIPAQNILIGETFNEQGSWSSFPSHKHDIDIEGEESCHEEVYFFKIKQKYGFGFQRIYSKDKSIDETFTVKDNCLSIIPKGYHPVVASPGTDLYYFWILSGSSRKLLMHTDPDLKPLL